MNSALVFLSFAVDRQVNIKVALLDENVQIRGPYNEAICVIVLVL